MRTRAIDPAYHHVYDSLDEFLSAEEYPRGILTVRHGGIPIDVRNNVRGHDTVMVFFHAAITKPNARLPMFTGTGISKNVRADRIFIADPSLYIDDGLNLSWYAGNYAQPDLQDVIAQILTALISPGRPVVTFGASGGGFAAMHFAARIPGALAVPVNPQVDLARYNSAPVKRWLRLGWGLDPETARLTDVPAETDSGRAYREGDMTRVWYVQNTGDANHMDNHFGPFMDSLPARHRISPVLIDGGAGHVPPPKESLTTLLSAAVQGAERPPSREQLTVSA